MRIALSFGDAWLPFERDGLTHALRCKRASLNDDPVKVVWQALLPADDPSFSAVEATCATKAEASCVASCTWYNGTCQSADRGVRMGDGRILDAACDPRTTACATEGDVVLGTVRRAILGAQGDFAIGDCGTRTVFGRAGDDLLFAGGGGGGLYGDAGNDLLHGGFAANGADYLAGGAGRDTVDYGDRPEPIRYVPLRGRLGVAGLCGALSNPLAAGTLGIEGDAPAADLEVIIGTAGDDYIVGTKGANAIFSGPGNDVVLGEAGNDLLYGEDGNDTLSGGVGNDTLFGGLGDDALRGDAGLDIHHGDRGCYTPGSPRATCPTASCAAGGGCTFDRFCPTGTGCDDLHFGGFGRDTFMAAFDVGADDMFCGDDKRDTVTRRVQDVVDYGLRSAAIRTPSKDIHPDDGQAGLVDLDATGVKTDRIDQDCEAVTSPVSVPAAAADWSTRATVAPEAPANGHPVGQPVTLTFPGLNRTDLHVSYTACHGEFPESGPCTTPCAGSICRARFLAPALAPDGTLSLRFVPGYAQTADAFTTYRITAALGGTTRTLDVKVTRVPCYLGCDGETWCSATGLNAGFCIVASCFDWIENGDEDGVDCGGDCEQICAEPSCLDGIRNGLETDVDCGGPTCAACDGGGLCLVNTDCRTPSEGCVGGICDSGEGCRTAAASGACPPGECGSDYAYFGGFCLSEPPPNSVWTIDGYVCEPSSFQDGTGCTACPGANCVQCVAPGACTQCADGYALTASGACVQAPESCPANSVLAGGACVCNEGFYGNPFTGACVSACPSTPALTRPAEEARECRCAGATWFNPVTRTCVACPLGCTSCVIDPAGEGVVCTSCAEPDSLTATPGYTLFAGMCVQTCPTGTRRVGDGCECVPGRLPSGGMCAQCPAGCATCTSSTACTACAAGYAFLDGSCTAIGSPGVSCVAGACASGSFCSAGRCYALPVGTTTTSCGACPEGQTCSGGTCYLAGPDGQPVQPALTCDAESYFDVSHRSCAACSANCDTCEGSSTACTSCVAPLVLDGGTCGTNCPGESAPDGAGGCSCGQMKYLSESTGSCVECAEGCLTCSGAFTCTDPCITPDASGCTGCVAVTALANGGAFPDATTSRVRFATRGVTYEDAIPSLPVLSGMAFTGWWRGDGSRLAPGEQVPSCVESPAASTTVTAGWLPASRRWLVPAGGLRGYTCPALEVASAATSWPASFCTAIEQLDGFEGWWTSPFASGVEVAPGSTIPGDAAFPVPIYARFTRIPTVWPPQATVANTSDARLEIFAQGDTVNAGQPWCATLVSGPGSVTATSSGVRYTPSGVAGDLGATAVIQIRANDLAGTCPTANAPAQATVTLLAAAVDLDLATATTEREASVSVPVGRTIDLTALPGAAGAAAETVWLLPDGDADGVVTGAAPNFDYTAPGGFVGPEAHDVLAFRTTAGVIRYAWVRVADPCPGSDFASDGGGCVGACADKTLGSACVATCPANAWADGASCLACGDGCATCTGATTCTACRPGRSGLNCSGYATVAVSYAQNGGAGCGTAFAPGFAGPYGTLCAPTRAGHAFDGWYTSSDFTDARVLATTVVSNPSAHSLIARWTTCTVPASCTTQTCCTQCGGSTWTWAGGACSDSVRPGVTGRSPVISATNVMRASDVTVTFGEAMDPASITGNITMTLLPGGTPNAAVLTWDAAARTATLDPDSDLTYDTDYRVTVKAAVSDIAGNTMTADVTWDFRTLSAPVPPTLWPTSAMVVNRDAARLPIAVRGGTVLDPAVPWCAAVVNGGAGTASVQAGVLDRVYYHPPLDPARDGDVVTVKVWAKPADAACAAPSDEAASATLTLHAPPVVPDFSPATTSDHELAGFVPVGSFAAIRLTGTPSGIPVVEADGSADGAVVGDAPTMTYLAPSQLTGAEGHDVVRWVALEGGNPVESFGYVNIYDPCTAAPATPHFRPSSGTCSAACPSGTVLDGQVCREQLAVTYDLNGGTGCSATFTARYGAIRGALLPGFQLCVPTRAGSWFDGWRETETADNGTGVRVVESSVVTATANHAVHAAWVTCPSPASCTTGTCCAQCGGGSGYNWSGSECGLNALATFNPPNSTRSSVPTSVEATFSQAMSAATITTAANWSLVCTGGGSYAVSGVTYAGDLTRKATVTLAQTTAAPDGASCTLTATTGIKDGANRSIAAGQTVTWEIDAVRPSVLTRAPQGAVANATGVTVTFSEPMSGLLLEEVVAGKPTNFRVEDAGTSIAGTVTYDVLAGPAWQATFVPATPFASGRAYTVYLNSQVVDLAGNSLLNPPETWSFIIPGPQVSAVAPAANASGVDRASDVTATFDVAMDATSLTTMSFTVSAAGTPVNGTVSWNPTTKTVTFNPTADLPLATLCTATLSTAVKDATGVALAQPFTWSFTTITAPPPQVAAVSPVHATVDVVRTTTVSATFDSEMSAASFTATSFTVRDAGGNAVAGARVWDSGLKRVTFTPDSTLAASTVYTATLTTAVTNASGVALVSSYSSSFTTAAPAAPPTVQSVSPTVGATNIARPTSVSATFSAVMDPTTFDATSFVVSAGGVAVDGTRTYNDATRTVTFAPTALSASTTYTARLTTFVADMNGTPLAADYSWTFTTAAPPAGPEIVSVTPAQGVGDVLRTTTVTANFSTAMAADSFTNNSFRVEAPGGVEVYGTRTLDSVNNRITFTPSASLLAATTYTATMTTGVKSSANVALATTFSWTFTTAAAPVMVGVTPSSGGTNVATGTTVTATFNVDMNASTFTVDSFKVTAGSTAVAGTRSYDAVNRRVTFTPSAALAGTTTYTAVLTSAVTGANGVALDQNTYWSFTTTGVPPTVTAVTPTSNATGVSTATTITATFSADMRPSSFTASSFTITAGGVAVAGARTYDAATRKVTFTPAGGLTAATNYTATLTTAVTNGNVQGLAANYAWSFTTSNQGACSISYCKRCTGGSAQTNCQNVGCTWVASQGGKCRAPCLKLDGSTEVDILGLTMTPAAATASTSWSYFPIDGVSSYSMSAHIYPRASLGQTPTRDPRFIWAITIDLASWPGTLPLSGQEIWLSEVTADGRFDADPSAAFSDLTFVTGKTRVQHKAPFTFSPGGTGQVTVNLDKPFCYTGVGDLVIDWRNNAGSTPGPVAAKVISGTNQGMFLMGNIAPASPWSTNGFRTSSPMWVTLHY